MKNEMIENLQNILNNAAAGLNAVSGRKMFGCHALFAGDQIFGLVWKEGRIGVRLPEATEFDALMAKRGASPWKAGKMTMSHWVLVPEPMHDDGKALRAWVKRAHRLALAAPAKKGMTKARKTKAEK